MFYLAQSYKDAGDIPNAIKYYTKRFNMGRWAEEVFVSGLNITRLYKMPPVPSPPTTDSAKHSTLTERQTDMLLDSVDSNKKRWAWRAHEKLPTRTESLYEYLKWVRENNRWSREALAMGLYAIEIPKPKEGLFLDSTVYDWKLFDEVSIIAYYCGRKDISRRLSERILSEGKFPEDQRSRIESNLKFA
jgi:hypothetical protein